MPPSRFPDSAPQAGARPLPALVLLAILAILPHGGCGKASPQPSDGPQASSGGDPAEAAQLLHAVRQAYADLDTYADRMVVEVAQQEGEQTVREQMAVYLQFQRPGKLRLRLVQGESEVRLARDGQALLGGVVDPESGNFDGQRVEYALEGELRVEDLYRATECLDPQRPGELASLLLALPIRLDLSPLGLLLAEPVWLEWTRSDQLTLLPDQSIGGRGCRRVQVGLPEGPLELWIDRQSRLVRRIALPPQSVETAGERIRLQVTAEIHDIRQQPPVAMEPIASWLPEAQHRLRHFLLPPVPMLAPLVGQPVGDYHFTTLEGERETSAALDGGFQVLLWFQDDEPSRAALPLVEQVGRQFADNPRVAFRAVCTEPTTEMSHSDVQALVRSLGVTLPVVRDLDAVGRDVLQIESAPTLVVLDPHHTVHLYQVGARPDMAAILGTVLHQLLAGQNVAQEARRQEADGREDYQRHLAAASVEAPEAQATASARGIAPVRPPRQLQLETAWESRELENPGNLLVVDGGGGPRLLALEGWKEVVELDLEGRVRARHPLPMDSDGAVTFLRPAVDGQGNRYYVATARLARACYVFDSNWERICRYPPPDQPHPGVTDALAADLDQDGSLELYVGFQGVLGVHRVDLDGRRVWVNRRMSNILSLALSPSGEELLATSDQGTIVAIGADARDQPPQVIAGHAVHQLGTVPAGPEATSVLCGLAYTLAGRLAAVGLDGNFRPVWQQTLPDGVFRSQILLPVPARMTSGGHHYWWLAGPDGSVYAQRADGQVADQWATGADVQGLAAGHVEGADWVWISQPGRIVAQRIAGLK